MPESMRIERDGAVAILVLQRPEVLNAFNEQLTSELGEALEGATHDPGVRAVVVTGAGRGFSAGQDLADRGAMIEAGGEVSLGDELRRRYHPITSSIRAMPKPVIAAVNGVAAGAGLGLALACDVRVATASATFRAAWARVGLVPDAGAAYFLPRLVGWGRAMDMIVSGEAVNADDALRFGLVTRVWADLDFENEWRAYARALATGATQAFALSKEALKASEEHDLSSFFEIEAELQDRAGRTHDYAEGVRAFRGKRRAEFEGR